LNNAKTKDQMEEKNVALVFRSKARKEYSIETLFACLENYLCREIQTEKYYLPCGHYNRPDLLVKNYLFARKIKSDLYHITGEVNFIAPAFPKDKTIITIHDFVDLETMHGIKKIIRWIFWYQIPFRHCKYLACISQKTLNETIRRFPFVRGKAVYIPNPIDDRYQPIDRAFNSDNPQIMVVGTRENKNLERIIEAVKDLPCNLYIIGILTDEQKYLLEKNRVEYENVYRISDGEMREAYINSDIVCFPSTYEGFGRPIIEANAVGRAVLTSDIPPLNEVAGDAAILVDPYSVESIRTGLERLIKDKNYREKLIRAGLENVKQFKAEKVAAMYIDLYNNCRETGKEKL